MGKMPMLLTAKMAVLRAATHFHPLWVGRRPMSNCPLFVRRGLWTETVFGHSSCAHPFTNVPARFQNRALDHLCRTA